MKILFLFILSSTLMAQDITGHILRYVEDSSLSFYLSGDMCKLEGETKITESNEQDFSEVSFNVNGTELTQDAHVRYNNQGFHISGQLGSSDFSGASFYSKRKSYEANLSSNHFRTCNIYFTKDSVVGHESSCQFGNSSIQSKDLFQRNDDGYSFDFKINNVNFKGSIQTRVVQVRKKKRTVSAFLANVTVYIEGEEKKKEQASIDFLNLLQLYSARLLR